MTTPPRPKAARSGPLFDRIFAWLAKGSAIFTLVMLVAILGSLLVSAWPAIAKYGLGFLASTTWDPVKEEFGGLVMIYGTLMTSLIALLIAVPVSFGKRVTNVATPSLPLPPWPPGQFTAVPSPTFSFHSGWTRLR
jgi:phosphate transport system permease protein